MGSILEINPQEVRVRHDLTLVDVREPHELSGPEGHITGVISAPLSGGFAHFLMSADPEKTYVFVCRSGCRSAKACEIALVYGFQKAYNLKGGMLAWNQKGAV
jgi:rhodanese-related sulfurtransferase